MRTILEFLVFLLVALVWVTLDWLARHAQNLLFTFGLLLIVIGFAFVHISLAFIVPGCVICGLLTLGRLLALRSTPVRKEGGDA